MAVGYLKGHITVESSKDVHIQMVQTQGGGISSVECPHRAAAERCRRGGGRDAMIDDE
jgi:hypothetical protein